MLTFINHNQGTDIIGYSLRLRNAPIRLLDEIKVLINVLKLCADNGIFRNSQCK